jgi:hypothetical protein
MAAYNNLVPKPVIGTLAILYNNFIECICDLKDDRVLTLSIFPVCVVNYIYLCIN